MAQSFLLAAILGIFFTIISLIFREPILTASGAV
jgi:Na+-driven multidrug efflux pump